MRPVAARSDAQERPPIPDPMTIQSTSSVAVLRSDEKVDDVREFVLRRSEENNAEKCGTGGANENADGKGLSTARANTRPKHFRCESISLESPGRCVDNQIEILLKFLWE